MINYCNTYNMVQIKLNVCGKLFETTDDILRKSTYFDSLLTRWNNTSDVIFINRSSHIFKHVLGVLIDSHYPFPKKYEYELHYFGIAIEYDVDEDENLINISNKINELDDKLEKYMDKQLKLTHHKCASCSKLISNSAIYCEYHKRDSKSGCWLDNMMLYKRGYGWTISRDLKIGDYVATGYGRFAKITNILNYTYPSKKIVDINGVLLTHGHPVFKNNEWYRAYELNKPYIMNNINVMNLELDEHHSVLIVKRNSGDNCIMIATHNKFSKDWHK